MKESKPIVPPKRPDARAMVERMAADPRPTVPPPPPAPAGPSAMALKCAAVLAAQLQGRVSEATARAWAGNIDREPAGHFVEADWTEAARALARNPPERIGYSDWLALARRAAEARRQPDLTRRAIAAESAVERFTHASEPLAPWLAAKIDERITAEDYELATGAILRGEAVPPELRAKAGIGGGDDAAA